MSSSSNYLQVQCSPIRNNQLKVYWFLLQWIVEVFKELQKVPCRFFFWFRSRVWTMSLRKAPKLVGKSTLTTLLPDVTSKWSPANPRMLYTLLPIAAAKYILPPLFDYFAFFCRSDNTVTKWKPETTLVVPLICHGLILWHFLIGSGFHFLSSCSLPKTRSLPNKRTSLGGSF